MLAASGSFYLYCLHYLRHINSWTININPWTVWKAVKFWTEFLRCLGLIFNWLNKLLELSWCTCKSWTVCKAVTSWKDGQNSWYIWVIFNWINRLFKLSGYNFLRNAQTVLDTMYLNVKWTYLVWSVRNQLTYQSSR
jgi:hypothetical protein